MRALSILLLLTLSLVSVFAYSEKEYKEAFVQWMHDYKKTYTVSDFQVRYAIFKDTMDFVQNFNEDISNSHKVALNQFSDLTNEEYRNIYLGTRIDGTQRLLNAAHLPQPEPVFPEEMKLGGDIVNWVDKGAVTGVKNQGQCGSCWSFSATGSTEGITFLTNGNLISLSEQNLLDCSGSYGNQGCDGGLPDYAFQYIIANGGVDTEASYPYTAVQGTCQFSSSNVGANITSFADVQSGSESDLQNAVNNQPVSVAIDASQPSFQSYSSGIYNDSSCSTTQLDHAVLVVGYGTDNNNNAYWIVKNSWGTSWGQQGYFWLAMNDNNMCGVATQASYPSG